MSAQGVRGEILAFLSDFARPQGWSDNEIAGRIGRPLPSVRRTRRQLELDDYVTLAGGSSSQVLRWKRR